jgi:chromosome transmission fidelity protein 8
MAVPPSRLGPSTSASAHTPFALPVTGAGGKGGAGGAARTAPPEWALVELQGELEPPAGCGTGLDYEAGTLALSKTVRGKGASGEEAWEEAHAPPAPHLAALEKKNAPRAARSPGLTRTRPAHLLPPTFQNPGGVELTVGIHCLEGSVVPLKKPFAVLEKRGGRDAGASGGGGADGDADPAGAASQPSPSPSAPLASPVRYEVVGVIRRKCLFKTRPRALITGPGALARQVEAAAVRAAAREEEAAAATAAAVAGVGGE